MQSKHKLVQKTKQYCTCLVLFIKGVFNNEHVCKGGLQYFNINYAGGHSFFDSIF